MIVFALTPTVDAQLVTCGNDITVTGSDGNWLYSGECTICDLQQLAQRIINWFVVILVMVAALLFVNAGVLYVTAPSNPGNISRAHRIFTNTLIGILLILAAWLLIDFIMRTMLPGDGNVFGTPWNEMLCEVGTDSEVPIPAQGQASLGVQGDEIATTTMQGVDLWYQIRTSRDDLLIAISGTQAIVQHDPRVAAHLEQLVALRDEVALVDPFANNAQAQMQQYWGEFAAIHEDIIEVTGVQPGDPLFDMGEEGVTSVGIDGDTLGGGDESNHADTGDYYDYTGGTGGVEVGGGTGPSSGSSGIITTEVQETLARVNGISQELAELTTTYPDDLREWNDDIMRITNRVVNVDIGSEGALAELQQLEAEYNNMRSDMIADFNRRINDEYVWRVVQNRAAELNARIGDLQSSMSRIHCAEQRSQLPALSTEIATWHTNYEYDDDAHRMLNAVESILNTLENTCPDIGD
jgi:hypothetical protein